MARVEQSSSRAAQIAAGFALDHELQLGTVAADRAALNRRLFDEAAKGLENTLVEIEVATRTTMVAELGVRTTREIVREEIFPTASIKGRSREALKGMR